MKELFGHSNTGWNGGIVDLSYDSGEDLSRELSLEGSLYVLSIRSMREGKECSHTPAWAYLGLSANAFPLRHSYWQQPS